MDVKETAFLCKVTSEDEVLELVAAFVQLYRENSRYLHRIYKWVARVGLDGCKAQMADPVNRRALYDRFMRSQSVFQKDPWAEHGAPPEHAKWHPLAELSLEAAE